MSFDPITAALEIGGKLIDRLWPDPLQAASAKLQLATLQMNGELAQIVAEGDIAKAQIAVNAAEAASQNLFVAGWRPFIGWVCGGAFAYHFLLQPLVVFGFTAVGHPIPVLPVFETETLNTVLYGILGLGTLRTVEKTGTISKIASFFGK